MSSVIVVGSLNADMVVRVSHIPVPGETVIAGKFETIPGGKGANQAVAAARLGGNVSIIGRVGSDTLGELLCANLEIDRVNHQRVVTDPSSPTGIALIEVSETGQNSIVVVPGANHQLMPQDILAAEGLFERGSILLLQLEIPMETVLYSAQLAHDRGSKVVLNPAPAQPLPSELISLVDILVPNETEATLLTGIPVSTIEMAREAGTYLHALGIGIVIITLGEHGCLLVDSSGFKHFPAFPIQVVDSTAAGDAFIGAFAVALAEDHSTAEAVTWGRAGGALAASKKGAQPSLPNRSDLILFLQQHDAIWKRS